MWKALLSAIAAVAILAIGLFIGLEKPHWIPGVEGPSDRVLVFVVGTPEGVDLVREAVDADRIVASTERAIALVEGRIVTADVESATGPYTEAGWTERDLEFFVIAPRDRPTRSRVLASNGAEMDPERLARLNALLHKPTLSYGEQVFILQAMNEGFEF